MRLPVRSAVRYLQHAIVFTFPPLISCFKFRNIILYHHFFLFVHRVCFISRLSGKKQMIFNRNIFFHARCLLRYSVTGAKKQSVHYACLYTVLLISYTRFYTCSEYRIIIKIVFFLYFYLPIFNY